MQNSYPFKMPELGGVETLAQLGNVERSTSQSAHALRHHRPRWELITSVTAITGDLAMILAGFILAFWVRFQSGFVFPFTAGAPALVLADYWKLILFGTVAVFGGMLSKGSYAYKDLLAPKKTLGRFIGILSVGLFAFIGITMAVRTNPPISRVFVIYAWVFILLTVYGWRVILSRLLQHPALVLRLRKRLVVVGAGPETVRIKEELMENCDLEFVGWVQSNKPNRAMELEPFRLGSLHELDEILRKYAIDVAVLAESVTLQREGIMHVAKICEREHVHFKMVPHFFEILVSGLSSSVVGGVSVLGVDALPMNMFENRLLKRTVDVLGATIGLLLACPLILIFGALVYWESPGPIFYRQVRTGRDGRLFSMIKIRSMKMNAEGDGKAVWTQENDPRRLKIGALMRKWNIDEIPQFWNVLKGDMSLIGPRPERPELIHHFKYTIPHYQIRHTCCPGMSGWAQVNGWRGNTSLEKRISYDIWYVEHWSLFLDLKIMLLTFFKRQNAY
jgi:exopolysaccharide biosynthesis polyprenyl glycosylphosphotransferase